MDEARQAADLPTLTEAKIFPAETETDSFNSFCYTLLNVGFVFLGPFVSRIRAACSSRAGSAHVTVSVAFSCEFQIQPPENAAREAFPGTPAIFKIDEETSPGCSAAVKDWQGGFSSFEENPPVKKETNGYSELDDKAHSFVALYNPSDKIQGHCQVIVCEEKTTKPAEPGQQQVPQVREEARGDGFEEDEEDEDEDEGMEPEPEPDSTPGPSPGSPGTGAEENDGAQGKKSSALVCLTYPNALDKNPLFT
ncbi:hypothetical protein Emag_004118 [Eimeria magna]